MKVFVASSLGRDKLYCLPFLLSALRGLCAAQIHIVCDGFAVPEQLAAEMREGEAADSLPDLDGAEWTGDNGARTGRVRELQRQAALDSDCTHLYFHDADMLPPVDILALLGAHGLPATSGIYNMRGHRDVAIPAAGTPTDAQPGLMTGLLDLPACAGGYLAAHMGMGSMLLDRSAMTTPFRNPQDLHGSGVSEDVAWGADYFSGGGRIFVDPTVSVWHVDADNTANRLIVGEAARGAIWTDTPHFVRNAFGLWERGVPVFCLSEEALAALGPGFVVGDYPHLTVEVRRLEEIYDNGSIGTK